MNAQNTHLTFSAEKLAAMTVATAKARAETCMACRWTIEDRDGDAWAALEVQGLDQDDRMDWLLTFTIQLTTEPGRRFVALAANGRDVVGAGDNLTGLLAPLMAAFVEVL